MSLASFLVGCLFGGLTIFVAGSLWFFGLIDSGIIRWRSSTDRPLYGED
jgi:hypothetical protein